MKAVWVLLLVCLNSDSRIHWVEQDLSGVRVGGLNRFTGEPVCNFRHTDLDADGAPDLIFHDSVVFARNGGVQEADRVRLPDTHEPRLVDVGTGEIFLLTSEQLVTAIWAEDQWAVQEHHLDTRCLDAVQRFVGSVAGSQLARFLHDCDGDGRPEVIIPDEDGLHILRQRADTILSSYAEAVFLHARPRVRATHIGPQLLWPPAAREISLPLIESSYQSCADGDHITIIEREDLNISARYHVCEYRLRPVTEWEMSAEEIGRAVSPPLPDYMQPCRLNDDAILDYAGERVEWAEDSPFPTPVHEAVVSTDDGRAFTRVRSLSLAPHCLFVDYDGDGARDLVTERLGLFDGGLRETVLQFMTQRMIQHVVRVHLQREDGSFPRKPDIEARFTIDIEQPPLAGGEMFQQYKKAELVNITGDFTGNGIRDAMVKLGPGLLALYRGAVDGFASQPDMTLPLPPSFAFAAADIDGDGRCDLLVRWPAELGADGVEKSRVYLTRDRDS